VVSGVATVNKALAAGFTVKSVHEMTAISSGAGNSPGAAACLVVRSKPDE
jgi:hypothetical protein